MTKKITYRCRDCGSTDVLGQASAMIPLNNIPDNISMDKLQWDDYDYCNQCQDDCKVEATETEEQA